ncbi:MAG: NAD(P)/FAD-dependent oxidoreductase [Candidatus Acidiferrales bacterium]|jgi:2-polyprenyl-6-methoxyphenol hydroxylase-like FAD-dependent oxidoreductase
MQTDVLIIGGGPAGLATAIAARAKGFRVTVVDSRTPPINKACGEGLLPEAVNALHGLGIDLDPTVAIPFAGILFSDGDSSASARFGCGTAFGLRRTALHRLLIHRANETGVSLLWGARVSSFDFAGARANGNWIRCRWLIGADGQRSSVRKFARLEPRRRTRSRFGFRRHYAVAPWTDVVEVHWGERCEMVVTPTGAEEVCISFFTSDPHLRMDRALARFPEVAQRLQGTHPVSTQAGAVTSLDRAHAVARGNIALVGDASCTVDGIAGQGMSLAFQQALALAEALGREDLAHYESAHRRITQTAACITRLLLLMNASTAIRRKALRLFAARPEVFAKIISIHAGELAPDALGADILDLGWRILWA